MHLGFATVIATVSATAAITARSTPAMLAVAALALATPAAFAILATTLAVLLRAAIIATLRLVRGRGAAVGMLGGGLLRCCLLGRRSCRGRGLARLVLTRMAIAIVAASVMALAAFTVMAARTPDVFVFDLGFSLYSRRLHGRRRCFGRGGRFRRRRRLDRCRGFWLGNSFGSDGVSCHRFVCRRFC